MITHKLLPESGIAIVEPSAPLSEEDFVKLAESVDAFLENHEALKGLLIHTRQFPGWKDFEGFIHHMQFVRDHHRKIKRVALVSDSRIASIAPRLAKHFVSAEVKSFHYDDYDDALSWLQAG